MTAWYSRLTSSEDDLLDTADLEAADHHARWVPAAEDRIAPPPPRHVGKRLRRIGMVVLFAAGTGWALLGGQEALPAWLRAEVAAMSSSLHAALEQRLRAPAESPAPATAAPDLASNAAAAGSPRDEADRPAPRLPQPLGPPEKEAATVGPAPPPLTTAALPTEPAPHKVPREAQAYALPNPVATTPHQKRAEAVGLHPELSGALLERMSATDYRNAGIAIATAITETPDTGVLVWPRQRKPELAQFEVRFVPGAAPDCRRYVVSVVKDGWSTTAMPMEKCGVARRAARKAG